METGNLEQNVALAALTATWTVVSTIFAYSIAISSWLTNTAFTPVRVLLSCILVLLTPITYPVWYISTAMFSVITFLLEDLEPLIIFLSIAVYIGMIGGVSIQAIYGSVVYIFGINESDPPDIKEELETEVGSWEDAHSSPGSDLSFPESLLPANSGKQKLTLGRPLLSETIHEEEDSL
ncbi:hypothetical protein B0H67DRAFT_189039 [Lasiosphaeris hirsuta]|uniref:Uncharacterized protein n=1 Tax=Lasiosphaeris hirsuta TaxID=260670 RepID=A0AA40AR36_9PEZI|nr:hypothetical protein B0H67DRAFT_189039 [Lasiosphaeris hirsuta]